MNISPEIAFVAVLAFGMIPAFAAVGTSYLKISIVLNLLKSGFGAQGVPGTLGIFSLSMLLSLYVMAQPFQSFLEGVSSLQLEQLHEKNLLDIQEELQPTLMPWREFLLKNTNERELFEFSQLQQQNPEEPSFISIVTAFVVTELKESFAMGLVLLIPFLVIDIVVASILVGMGMFMVSPVFISMPLKLLFFVMVDGWLLISKSLIQSYG